MHAGCSCAFVAALCALLYTCKPGHCMPAGILPGWPSPPMLFAGLTPPAIPLKMSLLTCKALHDAAALAEVVADVQRWATSWAMLEGQL